jgi:hypothetical protein
MGKASRRKGQRRASPEEAALPGHPQLTRYQKIRNEYGTAMLFRRGPLVTASWQVPDSVANALQASGRVPPDRVSGAMLVDTGATRTCISRKAAEMLGLQPIRLQPGYGSGGATMNPLYVAKFSLDIAQGQFSWEQHAQGIPDLDRYGQGVAVAGRPMEVIGLLGRDVLSHTKLTYDGIDGTIEIILDLGSLQRSGE